jgi:hypothetical protein
MKRRLIAISLLALGSSLGAADEYFGEFLDPLKGTFLNDAKPRPKFRLDTTFRFKDPNGLLWAVPAGTEVDGASIPQMFWTVIGGPFEGAYINASVVHDYFCNAKSRTAHDTHRSFYYGMLASQVPEWTAKFMYWAVATFGPDWRLEKRIMFSSKCKEKRHETQCTETPELHELNTVQVSADLADPQVLAAALSKAHSVARSLKTSNGRILDVSTSGQVVATLENIDDNAQAYRELFISKGFLKNSDRLGVLSQWHAEITPWAGDKIPTMGEAVYLTTSNIKAIEKGKGFKVDPSAAYLIQERLNLHDLKFEYSPGLKRIRRAPDLDVPEE